MIAEPFKLPFIDTPRVPSNEEGYFKMLQSRFIPNFQWVSLSTLLLGINVVTFIIIHLMFAPPTYQFFLEVPTETNDLLLNVEKVKNNPVYVYQAFTAMFMHENYLHILGNMIFGLFIMYEMEFSWRWSVLLGVLVGFVANCMAVLTMQGRLLGFSAVLASYVGMIIGLICTHCTYIRNRFPGMAFCMVIMFLIFVSVMVVGIGGASFLIHLYGYVLGILAGAAFFPKHQQSDSDPRCDMVMKGVCVGIWVVIVVLAIVL